MIVLANLVNTEIGFIWCTLCIGVFYILATPPNITLFTISVPNPHLADNIDIKVGREPSDGLVMCIISAVQAETQEPGYIRDSTLV